MRAIDQRSCPSLLCDWGSGLLVGIALLVLALLPWLSPTPGSHRIVATLVLTLGGALAIWLARPRRISHAGWPKELGAAQAHGSPPRAILLTDRPAEARGRAGRSYAATTRLTSGREVSIAEDGDPSVVLRAATACAHRFDVPLSPGWGLTHADLRALTREEPTTFRGKLVEVIGRTHTGARGTAISLVLCAATLLLLVGTVVIQADVSFHPLSWFLWALAVLLLLLLATVALTDRIHIRGQPESSVLFERRVLGIAVRRLEVPGEALRVVRMVTPVGSTGKHLLIAAADRCWSLQCEHAVGKSVEEQFERLCGPGAA